MCSGYYKELYCVIICLYIHSTKKVSPPPPSIFPNISKSTCILPILIIPTVMDRKCSYAKNEWYVFANLWYCSCEIMHFMTKGVNKNLALLQE